MQAWKPDTVDLGLALSRLRRLVATVLGQRCNPTGARCAVAAVGRCSGTRDDDVTIVIAFWARWLVFVFARPLMPDRLSFAAPKANLSRPMPVS